MVYKCFLLIKNDSIIINSVLLFETMFCEYQKLTRDIKQARLVNIVLGAVVKRTHETKNHCI